MNSYWNQSTIYLTMLTDPNVYGYVDVGVDPGSGRVCTNCSQTLTIEFSQPVSNFSFTVYNGLVSWSPVYQVVINGTVTINQFLDWTLSPTSFLTYPFPPEYQPGPQPTSNILQVTITPVVYDGYPPSPYPTGGWDFFIDNITYTRPDTNPCVPPVPTVQTNPSCNPSLGACSANIVRGDGAEQTNLYVSVDPPVSIFVGLTADFGSVSGVQTNASGRATTSYTAGMAPNDATTTIGKISADVDGDSYPDLAEVYNFSGFAGFNFHQAQVSDARFTAHTEWGVSQIQAFFQSQNSFFAKFYLVGSQGDRGFFDTNGNGNYDSGEPTYCATGSGCSMSGPKTSAAQAFVNAATKNGQRVNPKILLVQAQKEKSLVSSATLPSAQLLNAAFGCNTNLYPNFLKQLDACAAKTLRNHFDTAPTMPHFFPGTTSGYSINHFVYNPQVGSLGSQVVAFNINTKGTYSLFKYTNHITTSAAGGGNYLFQELWQQYQF